MDVKTIPPSLETCREEIARAVLEAGSVTEALRETGERRGWWPGDRRWVCTYGRFEPWKKSYCRILFETRDDPQRLCSVELFESPPNEEGGVILPLPDPLVGWMRLNPFPSDSRLPSLAAVISGAGKVRVLRYRPGRRCTLRMEDPEGGHVRFAKVFQDDRGKSIHQESIALRLASCDGELDFDVAPPGHWDSETNTLWQGSVPGDPVVSRLFTHGGLGLAERMGQACASITRSTLIPSLSFGAEDQLARTSRYVRDLVRYLPGMKKEIQELWAELNRLHTKVSSGPLRPIHGAPHAHQWLDTGSRLGLVDFDRFCIGDPELDAATFIAEMDFENRKTVPVDDLNRAFLSGYESVAGTLNQPLLRAYRAHKRLSKALKAARAVRPNALERAARNLRRAREILGSVS